MFTLLADSDITQTVGTIVTGVCTVITAIVAGYIAIIQAKEKIKARERFEDADQKRLAIDAKLDTADQKRQAMDVKLDTVQAQIKPLVDQQSSMGLPAVDTSRKESK